MTESGYEKVSLKEIEFQDKQDDNPTKYGYGVRHVQALLLFVCVATGHIAKAHLGVTIVAMTTVGTEGDAADNAAEFNIPPNNTVVESGNGVTELGSMNVTFNNITGSSSWNLHQTYGWTKSIQEMALGSFFLGQCVMLFPIGMVCQKWGGKIPLQIAMLVNGVVSLFTPWLVAWGGWKALCVCRMLQGLTLAGLFPGALTMLTNWVPVSERGSLNSYVFTGVGFGAVIGFQMGGILAYSRFGWPSTFWITGVTCLIAFILITAYGATKPSEHKSISEAEKSFIIGTINDAVQTKPKVPWKRVFTSVPVWATFITHMGNLLCYIFFFMQVPTYMSAILKLNIKDSGVLSSLPYIAVFFSTMACGYISDYCTNRKLVSVKNARKISNSIATVVPSLILFVVSYTRDTTLAVVCFIVAMTAQSALHTGWMLNYVDLSPNYSGALLAAGSSAANFLTLILPILVSNIVTDVTNQQQWRITMFLMGVFTTATNVFFLICMSVDVQPWNDYDGTAAETKEIERMDLQVQKKEPPNPNLSTVDIEL